jgi:5-methylcytosine-specific restriction endonuclease McrA
VKKATKKKSKLDLSKPDHFSVYSKMIDGSIKAALRKIWLWSKLRSQALKSATLYGLNGKRRVILGYKCASCLKTFKERNEIDVDHIESIGSWNDLNLVVERMLKCPLDNIQVLCKPCHVEKTTKDTQKLKRG